MATPRVFISSTCYDLSEVRDSLIGFFQQFGFECTLSERCDVFYHPDLHTHDSCIGEINNCQLFILIIGGRFGGNYKTEKKSITNAEYEAAKKLEIPSFTFIKSEVLSDHNVWQKNRKGEISEKIIYPSIDKKEHAQDIFEFIDSVRLSDTNNGFFGFTLAKEIHEKLRKQLAGMFFDFLNQRKLTRQIDKTNNSIADLSAASNKIEELIKAIYKSVDSANADETISNIDQYSAAEEFFTKLTNLTGKTNLFQPSELGKLCDSKEKNWVKLLSSAANFHISKDVHSSDGIIDILVFSSTSRVIAVIKGISDDYLALRQKELDTLFPNFLALSREQKMKILDKFTIDSGK